MCIPLQLYFNGTGSTISRRRREGSGVSTGQDATCQSNIKDTYVFFCGCNLIPDRQEIEGKRPQGRSWAHLRYSMQVHGERRLKEGDTRSRIHSGKVPTCTQCFSLPRPCAGYHTIQSSQPFQDDKEEILSPICRRGDQGSQWSCGIQRSIQGNTRSE